MHKQLIRITLLPICCLIATIAAAADQSIHIEWGYTPPSTPAVVGFILYQEGSPVCETQNPSATSMDCTVSLVQDTTNFTLTATFNDGTESPHSAPFPFSLQTDPDPTPLPESDGSHSFTFQWDLVTSTADISKYNIYLNDTLLCASADPTATTITCATDILNSPMDFTLTTVDTSGIESGHSNLLTFDPTLYPDLFNPKQITFQWEYDASQDVVGFRVYQNSELLCATSDPTTRELTCTTNLTDSTVTFAITAVDSLGEETVISNTISYSLPSDQEPTDPTPLTAVITATTTEGEAPLTVGFDAASSTGDIISFAWSFGDGSTETTNNPSNTFSLPGTYTTKLTVTDSNGETASASINISVTEAPVEFIPPTAVITSSATTGEAPFTISFDGSSSSATNSNLVSYTWNFGDGSSATGPTASHLYNAAGSYTASLTVTDSNGLSHSTTTSIAITEPQVDTNLPPTAVITASPKTGSYPLSVILSASGSSDSDGTIQSYVWNFGDGTSATGPTATHTYQAAANFIATLKVTDDKGATASTSTTITVTEPEQTPSVNIEVGEVAVSSDWTRVTFNSSFSEPVVIAGPPTFNDPDPGVIRLRNIDSKGFDIKFTEWDYLDGTHPEETVSYLVIEKGHHIVGDTIIEAGTFSGTTSFATHTFSSPFKAVPVVITTIASNNEQEAIAGRLKNVSTIDFAYYFREQEVNKADHANETVNYIAWQQGTATLDTVGVEASLTADAITHDWANITYQNAQEQLPYLLADIQTTGGKDTSTARIQNIGNEGFQVKIEEEQSKDTEVSHTTEVVGYLLLTSTKSQSVDTTKLVTFTWEFDSALEDSIAGFRMYVNGTMVCEENNVSVRSTTCVVEQADTFTFEIKAVSTTGEETNFSNQLQLAQ